MSDSAVQVQPDSTGKKVQTYENTVAGAVVEAQAVVQVTTLGLPVSVDQDQNSTRRMNELSALAAQDAARSALQTRSRERVTAYFSSERGLR